MIVMAWSWPLVLLPVGNTAILIGWLPIAAATAALSIFTVAPLATYTDELRSARTASSVALAEAGVAVATTTRVAATTPTTAVTSRFTRPRYRPRTAASVPGWPPRRPVTSPARSCHPRSRQ